MRLEDYRIGDVAFVALPDQERVIEGIVTAVADYYLVVQGSDGCSHYFDNYTSNLFRSFDSAMNYNSECLKTA